MDFSSYKTIIFDCDGVILNSNSLKTQAFYKVVLSYGENEAKKFLKYHLANGGVSRYRKFEYFLCDIVGKRATQDELDSLLNRYAKEVKNGLMECEITDGLEKLRKKTSDCKWILISGGKQEELREVFKVRGIDIYFNGGIFGSPNTKKEIFRREIENGNIIKPAVFFGDARLDYDVAIKFNIDFIFIYGWTEFKDWSRFFENKNVVLVSKMNSLVKDSR